ncbi:RidA family protein [Psychrobacter sp. SCQQ22]|jgi:2-iminobutanoate/2-iminopropanoate deaminase|uniref:Enamine deaminase RidA (YjgF/YER057c/UK114 family) n=1 Tax=Psychrobacter fozii TaxID=198480 RepID=A0A2V4V241_9GAMM|nr:MULTISPECIES: RidA family protein [Psychrobacter]MBF2720895.1 RidA family protein [Psychrobacter sp. NG254]MBH0006809.1 RidA family protein [Psychrobacter sp. SWN149]MBH0085919.1 RidA family protein [Psychrobacter sp. SCQQ22]PYE36538.1 enamine deaminase RidA (YjgF/YER057c/UK114 family) [Psychrobacter fozii]GAF58772.1 endoribonuclease L-PSP [Psychrobacter sp. JCM 18902]
MTTHSTKQAIKTSLYASKAPLEWAITSNGTLYTAQIPIDENGDVVAGGIEAQTRQTLDNLKHTLECANVGMDSVLQVMIYVTDRDYLKTVNQVYAEYFEAPYPNRAALVIAGLAREEMLVELVVYAAVP